MRRAKIQRRLGYDLNAKLLIIHADDIGLCHSANLASINAMTDGSVCSSSIMVNCPWFFEAAKFFQAKPELDIGVHITITSEWQNYKWGPLLPAQEVPSLVDRNGHFFGHNFHEKVTPEDVYKEAKAQINYALRYGLNISHLDCHMNCLSFTNKLYDVYVTLGKEFDLPILANQNYATYFGHNIDEHLDKEAVLASEIFMSQPSNSPKGLEDYYDNCFKAMSSGLNVLLVHPAYDNHEMRGIALDTYPFGAQWRQTDYDYFTSERCRVGLESNNIQLITWREVKEKLFLSKAIGHTLNAEKVSRN